jgi:hypothetical protein
VLTASREALGQTALENSNRLLQEAFGFVCMPHCVKHGGQPCAICGYGRYVSS